MFRDFCECLARKCVKIFKRVNKPKTFKPLTGVIFGNIETHFVNIPVKPLERRRRLSFEQI